MYMTTKLPNSRVTLSPFKSNIAKGKTHLIEQFDNMSALLDDVSDSFARFAGLERSIPFGSSGFCKDTKAQAFAGVINGDKDKAGHARALERRINRLGFDTEVKQRVASPVGGRPCVPAMLAGSPNAMRRRVNKPRETAPLTIVINVNSSAGITQATMEKRGIVIAALIQRLATVRPVTLYLCGTLQTSGQPAYIGLVRFPTAPLDLARLAYCLASQGLARGLFFALAATAGSKVNRLTGDDKQTAYSTNTFVQWPFSDYGYIDGRIEGKAKRETIVDDLGDYFKTDMFYVSGAFLGSQDHKEIVADELGWINNRMKDFAHHH